MEADENTHSPLVTPRLRTEADHKVVEVRETILNFHSVYAYKYILFLPRSQRFQVLEKRQHSVGLTRRGLMFIFMINW